MKELKIITLALFFAFLLQKYDRKVYLCAILLK